MACKGGSKKGGKGKPGKSYVNSKEIIKRFW